MNALEQFSLTVSANARIELAGDWSDIPAYCLENRGKVLNLAVDVFPYVLWARAQKTWNGKLEVISLDRDTWDCVNVGDRFEPTDPVQDPLFLLKATINHVLAPDNPALNSVRNSEISDHNGLRLVTNSSIPQGSGLGISSILPTCARVALESVLGVKHDLRRQCWDTYRMEIEHNLGSGWQDQIGGCFPGAKRVDYEPGVLPVINQLNTNTLFFSLLQELLILTHTGKGRDSSGILTFVADEIANFRSDHHLVFELYQLSNEVERAILKDSVSDFGRCLKEISNIQNRMGNGQILGSHADLMVQVQDFCLGSRICGAGGEGFLMFLAKDVECRDRLCTRLNEKGLEWRRITIGNGLGMELDDTSGLELNRYAKIQML